MFTEIIFGVVVVLVASIIGVVVVLGTAIIAAALGFGTNTLLAKSDKKSQLKVTLFLLGVFILARCMI